jgi:ATP-dependent Clp protease adaptor protein ClpS
MTEFEDDVIDKNKEEVKKAPPPKKFKVIVHNDDYTPMDIVVNILATVFRKDSAQASQIMLEAHKRGKAVIGIYPFSIAETKSAKANAIGKSAGFPFRTSIEQA